MAKTLQQGSPVGIPYRATGTVTAGQVLEGESLAIVAADAVAGELTTIYQGGIHQLPKAAGVTVSVGDKLYWSSANNNLTKTNTDIYAGLATTPAASGDGYALVNLNAG